MSRLKVRCRSKENVSNDRFLLNNRCFRCQEKIVSMRCINSKRAKYWRQNSTTTLFCTCYHILSSKSSTWHNDFITFFSNTYAFRSSERKQIQIRGQNVRFDKNWGFVRLHLPNTVLLYVKNLPISKHILVRRQNIFFSDNLYLLLFLS